MGALTRQELAHGDMSYLQFKMKAYKKLIHFENTLDIKREQLRIKEEAALKKEAVYKTVVVKKLSKKYLTEQAVNKGICTSIFQMLLMDSISLRCLYIRISNAFDKLYIL